MSLTEFFQEDNTQNINARSLELISLYNTLDDVKKGSIRIGSHPQQKTLKSIILTNL